MYKIRLILITMLALFIFVGCDEEEASQEEENTEEESAQVEDTAEGDGAAAESSGDIQRSLMWRIDGENGPVWLFGTIHGGVDASEWESLPADIREAISASETLVLEVDMESAEQEKIMEKMMLPAGETLSSKLSEEQWATLVETAGFVPAEALEQFQPWGAYSIILQGLLGEVATVDESIQVHAEARGLKVKYIESIEEQLEAVMGSIDSDVLAEALDDLEEVQAELDKLVKNYNAGDAAAIEELLFNEEDMEKHARMYELLFTERNQNWVPRIEEYLEQGNVFIAVGAGHFLGEGSVIELLAELGHKAERVPAP